MNRRDFLKLIGVSSDQAEQVLRLHSAAVLTPAAVLAAVPEKKQPELLVTEYVLPPAPGIAVIAGFVLPAPASTYCRARILLPADGPSEVALVKAVASGNGPAQVLLDAVRSSGGISVVAGRPIDVSVFSRDFVAVDWPAIMRRPPPVALEIDYTAFGADDEEFHLGLAYQSVGPEGMAPCGPFLTGGEA